MLNENISPLAELAEAVQWSEGMLLSPQHFQQSDVYWHGVARSRMASLDPDYWGLLSLSIDVRAWSDGKLIVSELSAIMPDGLPVSYPLDKEERQLSLDLNAKDLLPADGCPVRIWLGVPHRSGDSSRQDGYLQRYISCVGDMVVDENTGSNPTSVSRARVNLDLLTDEAQFSRHTAFPLMEVMRNADGHIEMSAYHPPMLRLGASGFHGENGLSKQLQLLSQKVWIKLRELAELCDEDNDSFSAKRYLEQARSLAEVLPQYDILTGSLDTHPRQAYLALSSLVGNVVGLTANPIPPLLFPYRHQECREQFRVALDYVQRRLEEIDTKMEKLPFSNHGENAFTRRLSLDCPTDNLIIELKPKAGQEFKNIKNWLDRARIASDDLMTVLRQRRLPGAKVRSLSRAERKTLGLKESALLFLIQNQNIEVDGKRISVFGAEKDLRIMGIADDTMPAGILLYRWKGGCPLDQKNVNRPNAEKQNPTDQSNV